MKIYLLPFILLSSLFFIGCGSGSSFDGDVEELKNMFVLNDSLSQEATLFAQDETIQFVLSLTNNTSEEITLDFSSGKQYDFFVKDSDGNEIWRSSDDQVFTQATTTVEIAVGDTVTFNENWDQLLSDGSVIAIGNYTAHGFVIGQMENQTDLTIQ